MMNIDGGGDGVDGSHFRSALLIAVVRTDVLTSATGFLKFNTVNLFVHPERCGNVDRP